MRKRAPWAAAYHSGDATAVAEMLLTQRPLSAEVAELTYAHVFATAERRKLEAITAALER